MIRVGIGGWTFEPWRGTFYPAGLPQKRELEHASRAVTTIEINGTFYRNQNPATFRSWASQVPDDFVFAVKAPRIAVIRKQLSDGAESIERFLKSGITELGDKLGPILWQLAHNKKYDPEDIAGFLALLPPEQDGRKLRHALEVRHETFKDPSLIALARKHKVAIVMAESDDYPQIADLSADFVYARLQRSREDEAAGYPAKEIKEWVKRAKEWEAGEAPKGLNYVADAAKAVKNRDVFLYFISGAKQHNPAAAMATIKELGKK